MIDQVECWSVILIDQARDVILSTALVLRAAFAAGVE